MRLSTRHRVLCDASTHWALFLDEVYVRRLACESLGCRSMEIVEARGTVGEGFHRRTRAVHSVDVPAPLRRMLPVGDLVSTVEEGDFDASTGEWRFQIIPSVLKNQVKITGRVWLERPDDTKGPLTRVFEADLSVNIPGLSWLVERVAESRMREAQDRIVEFTTQYLEETQRAHPG